MGLDIIRCIRTANCNATLFLFIVLTCHNKYHKYFHDIKSDLDLQSD